MNDYFVEFMKTADDRNQRIGKLLDSFRSKNPVHVANIANDVGPQRVEVRGFGPSYEALLKEQRGGDALKRYGKINALYKKASVLVDSKTKKVKSAPGDSDSGAGTVGNE